MEITGSYLLMTFGLLMVVFNIYATRETALFSFFTNTKKSIIIVIIWLVPVIGLFVAYKLMRLNLTVSSTGGDDGVQLYPGGSINGDNLND